MQRKQRDYFYYFGKTAGQKKNRLLYKRKNLGKGVCSDIFCRRSWNGNILPETSRSDTSGKRILRNSNGLEWIR